MAVTEDIRNESGLATCWPVPNVSCPEVLKREPTSGETEFEANEGESVHFILLGSGAVAIVDNTNMRSPIAVVKRFVENNVLMISSPRNDLLHKPKGLWWGMAIDGGLWSLIHQHIAGDFQRIELGAVGPGVPDINFCIDGVEGWIELKTTDTYTVPFRLGQVAWAARRTRAGGRVLLLTRRIHGGGPRKGDPVDELWVHWGKDVLEVHNGGLLAATPLLYQVGGPRLWSWHQVREALIVPLPVAVAS